MCTEVNSRRQPTNQFIGSSRRATSDMMWNSLHVQYRSAGSRTWNCTGHALSGKKQTVMRPMPWPVVDSITSTWSRRAFSIGQTSIAKLYGRGDAFVHHLNNEGRKFTIMVYVRPNRVLKCGPDASHSSSSQRRRTVLYKRVWRRPTERLKMDFLEATSGMIWNSICIV
jgi:hypothetical protein